MSVRCARWVPSDGVGLRFAAEGLVHPPWPVHSTGGGAGQNTRDVGSSYRPPHSGSVSCMPYIVTRNCVTMELASVPLPSGSQDTTVQLRLSLDTASLTPSLVSRSLSVLWSSLLVPGRPRALTPSSFSAPLATRPTTMSQHGRRSRAATHAAAREETANAPLMRTLSTSSSR